MIIQLPPRKLPPELDYFHNAHDMLSELIRMRHITKDPDSERYATIVYEALLQENRGLI